MGCADHNLKQYQYESHKKITIKQSEISPSRKNEIDQAIIDCVIEDGRPFGDFSKPGMLKLLAVVVPGYKPQARQTINRQLSKRYKIYRERLIQFLKSIKHLALTTDMWKNRGLLYFLALTLHFFDDDFNYVSLVIGFRKFIGRKKSIRLKNFIRNELNKLNIKEKIVATTADNAADIVKALKSGEFGEPFSCLCHNFNLTLKSLVKNKKENQEEIESQEIDSDEENDESENLSESEDQDSVDPLLDSNTLESDPESSSDEEEPFEISQSEVVEHVKHLFSRIRNFVKMVRKCGNICNYAHAKIKSDPTLKNIQNFIIDFHIRWNSTYLMLKRLVKLKDIVINMTERPERIDGITKKQVIRMRKLDLSQDDWLLISVLIKIFEPFFEATQMLSARKYPTLACSFVVKKVLFNSLNLPTNDQKEKAIKKFLLKNLTYHLEDKQNITTAQKLITLVSKILQIF